jgi:hypothetical protein
MIKGLFPVALPASIVVKIIKYACKVERKGWPSDFKFLLPMSLASILNGKYTRYRCHDHRFSYGCVEPQEKTKEKKKA